MPKHRNLNQICLASLQAPMLAITIVFVALGVMAMSLIRLLMVAPMTMVIVTIRAITEVQRSYTHVFQN